MSNWKERAEDEIKRQHQLEQERIVEQRRIKAQQDLAKEQEEFAVQLRNQELEVIGSKRIFQFDSLRLADKLNEINLEIMQGIGALRIVDSKISSKFATKVIVLDHYQPDPNNVSPKTEFKHVTKLGFYNVFEGDYYNGEIGQFTGGRSVRKFGFHEEYVGKEIVGASIGGESIPVTVAFSSDLNNNRSWVGVQDELFYLKPPVINLPDGWTKEKGRIWPDFELPFDYSWSNGAIIGFPADDFRHDLISEFTNDCFLQIGVARLPRVEKWLQDRMLADRRAKETEARKGQILKR